MRPWKHVVAVAAAFIAPASPSLGQADPPTAPSTLVERAGELVRASRTREARAVLREAWDKVEAMPASQRETAVVQNMIWSLGRSAWSAGDLEIARRAWTMGVAYRERVFPADHAKLQIARGCLAQVYKRLGDLPAAQSLEEGVLAVFGRTLPADHRKLQEARRSLAATLAMRGDLDGARELQTKVLDVYRKTLPADSLELQRARGDLAATLSEFGDLAGARRLQEKALRVLEVLLDENASELLLLQSNFAATLHELGDLRGAMALQQRILETHSTTMPPDHPDVQSARVNLANTMQVLGDLAGARALQEKVLSVRERKYPNDHIYLQMARHNLANTMYALGDLVGARELEERVLADCLRTLPGGSPVLPRVAGNLAATLHALGDFPSARKHQERVLVVLEAALPEGHPDLLTARNNLSASMADGGDPSGALKLQRSVLETQLRTLPDYHADLQRTRANIASTLEILGDLDAAKKLHETVLGVRRQTLPVEHRDLQTARGRLARVLYRLGEVDAARTLALERCRVALQRLMVLHGVPREVGIAASEERRAVAAVLSLPKHEDAAVQLNVTAAALLTSQGLRGAELRATRRLADLRRRFPQRSAETEHRLRDAVAEVVNAFTVSDSSDAKSASAPRSKRLSEAVRRRDRVARELLDLDGSSVAVASDVASIAAKVPSGSAAVAIVGYEHSAPGGKGGWRSEERLAGFVLGPDGTLTQHDLGKRATVDVQVHAIRDAGVHNADGPLDALRELGTRVFAPLVAALPDGTQSILLAVDDALEVAPLHSVVLPDESLLGDAYVLARVSSLFDLLEDPDDEGGGAPELLAFGSPDFGNPPNRAASTVGGASSPYTRGGGVGNWEPLPNSQAEVAALRAIFEQAFDRGRSRAFFARDASKRALEAHAPNARFLHLSTHGYFAPEEVTSTRESRSMGRFDTTRDHRVSGLSPHVLAGLTLAGANLPPDELGRRVGIVTAEELMNLDLSKCYLAALSACETSLGVRRAGQSFASLHGALRAAGARFVLSSLWKVGDREAKDLMTDFYRRIWIGKQHPHEALEASRAAMRQRGARFRDWAGWVLVGR